MQPELLISFSSKTRLVDESADKLLLETPAGPTTFEKLGPGLFTILRLLATGGASWYTLATSVIQADDEATISDMTYLIDMLARKGLLCVTLSLNGTALATVVPISPSCSLPMQIDSVPAHHTYMLSRFAYMHRAGNEMVIESPLSHATIMLHSWHTMAVIAAMVTPTTSDTLASLVPDISKETISMLLALLHHTALLTPCNDTLCPEEDEHHALAQWEFHDLVFHTRSRMGRHTQPQGKVYPFVDTLTPLPAIKPAMSSSTIALFTPDLAARAITDPPFSQVLESRATQRTFATAPITADELGELLYRVARVKQVTDAAHGDEISMRPYPSGGARHALELYPVINTCEGIAPGLYHYCPAHHHLEHLADKTDQVTSLLSSAWHASGRKSMPHVLIIITARFQRVSWVYRSLAYTLLMKDTGCLYQTIYLVATAMGLAACALGNGNSDLFANVAKLDYYTETSVGECMLGRVSRSAPGEVIGDDQNHLPRAR